VFVKLGVLVDYTLAVVKARKHRSMLILTKKRKKKKEKRIHIEQAMPVKAAIYQKCHPMPATSLPTRDR
jgi:hypothetical protein